MLPILHIGPLHIVSFQLMMALGILAGVAVCCVQANWLGESTAVIWDLVPWTVFAGILGAEAYGKLVGGQMVWYGGFIFGVPTAIWRYRKYKLPAGWFVWGGAPAIAVGHALGRIGCFLAGDDYGKPTDSWVGVAFPHGAPPTFERVHPTQLYESAFLFLLAIVLFRMSRKRVAPHLVAITYLGGYGMWRFFIEFARVKTDHVLWNLTTAQLISIALTGAAAILFFVPSTHHLTTEK